MQAISGGGPPRRRHEANFALYASRVSTSTRNAIANTRGYWPGETCRRDISGGDIAKPGLPAAHRSRNRWIIDRRLARNQRVGASPRYATFDTCECTRASHVQNGLLDA